MAAFWLDTLADFLNAFVRDISLGVGNDILPFNTPGGPENVGKEGKSQLKIFTIPKLTEDEIILPSDVAGLRAFGRWRFRCLPSAMGHAVHKRRWQAPVAG